MAFPHTLSEFHSPENRWFSQQKCWWQSLFVCSSTFQLSALWCFFNSAPYLWLRENVLLTLAKLEFVFYVLKLKQKVDI